MKRALLVLLLALARRVAALNGVDRAVLFDAELISGYRSLRELPVLRDGLLHPMVDKGSQIQGTTYHVT